MMQSVSSVVLLVVGLLATVAYGDHDVTWTIKGNNRLPKPLSDFTATLIPGTSTVLLAGGCDSETGNVFVPDWSAFVCFSLSNQLYSYDIKTDQYNELADLPSARARHAAVIANNQLWLIGGRNDGDGLVGALDVYDIDTNRWSTAATLGEEITTSDNGAFVDKAGNIFMVGGYNAGYDDTYRDLFRFNANTVSTTGFLEIEIMAPMAVARGDIHAVTVTTSDQDYAYVTGGFSNYNNFCVPYNSVERYDIENNSWTTVAPLISARADKALVSMNGRIYAVGGETQIENKCKIEPNDLPEAGELTVAVDDVEVYEPRQGRSATWKVLRSLPDHRFRFPGVGYDATDTIYTFGGQQAYDTTCQCFRTSDLIVSYKDTAHYKSAGNTIMGTTQVTIATLAVTSLMGLFFF